MSGTGFCADCGHIRLWHMYKNSDGVGPCQALNGHCQCAYYSVEDHVGSDIQDAKSSDATADRSGAQSTLDADFPDFNTFVYDASSDSLVDPNTIRKTYEANTASGTADAEQVMTDATKILDYPNVEKSNPSLDRVSLDPGTSILAKDQPAGSGLENGYYRAGRLVDESASDKVEDDAVNHPSHYTAYPGIEVIQLTRWLGFNKGNAVKYIARAGLKSEDKKIEDLEKAIWYLNDELKMLRGEYGTFEG